MRLYCFYTTALIFCLLQTSGQGFISLTTPADSFEVKHLLSKANSFLATNSDKAMKYADEAMLIAEKISFSSGFSKACMLKADVLFNKKNYAAASDNYEKAKLHLQQAADDIVLGQLLKKIGDCFAKRSFFRPASENYRDAAILLRKTGQLKLLNECQEAQGSIALDFGRYRNAVTLYQRSLVVKRSLNDEKGIISTTGKLVNAYMGLKLYDSALFTNKQLQELVKNDEAATAGSIINDIIIYSFMAKPEYAETAKLKAEKLLNSQSATDERIKLYTANTIYYTIKDDKASVRKYIDSVGRLLTGSKNPEAVFTGLNYLAEINSLKGDFKTAYDMAKMAERYKDIFRNENINRASAEVENASDISLKEKEIELLNKINSLNFDKLTKEDLLRQAMLRESLLKDSSLANQLLLLDAAANEANLRKDQLTKEKELSLSLSRENELKQKLLTDERSNKKMLWLGLGVMTLLGTIIFIQYRRQKRKNTIINKQSSELEVLNKEIHHRVKNNLQVISSMLDLQSQSLNDEKATAIIKEGIQRVQSMAFIHQNLYQGDAVNSVNMNEYIKTLSNHLFQTYNIQSSKIKLHTQIENLNLHTDTAIPLGMILNELISNSLKYAFPQDAVHKGNETGDIWVAMKKNNNELLLQVKDNGVGLPTGFNPDNISSFGYEIIKAFSQKMKARMNIDGSNGTDVQIIISKFKTTA